MIQMKGITDKIRQLKVDERIVVSDTPRDNIYQIARRLACKVKVEKFVDGFYVTKVSEGNSHSVSASTRTRQAKDTGKAGIEKVQGVGQVEEEGQGRKFESGWMNDKLAQFLAESPAPKVEVKPQVTQPEEPVHYEIDEYVQG